MRAKLLNNHEELVDQDNKLDNIKKLGYEANDNMRSANQGLRQQRDVIQNVADMNAEIAKGLNEGNKIIVEMSRREFFYKIGLYFVVLALGITITVMLIVKIIRMLGG